MMAAGRAAERGKRVLLLEKNRYLGEKLKISGGGRCNVTNAQENEHLFLSHYGASAGFLHSSFAQFGMSDTFSFFTSRGLPLIIEAGNRAFPETQKALDVFHTLETYLKKGKVDVRAKTEVRSVIAKEGRIEKAITNHGEFSATSYILSTGGKSHPETGSTGDGFAWLKQLGHTVEAPTPTIVPLAVSNQWVKALAGITLPDVKNTFFVNGKKKLSRKGNILCAHFGLTGPTILNVADKVSDMLQEGAVTAEIDLYPALDLGALDKYVTTIFDSNKNKTLKNVFKLIAPVGSSVALLSLVKKIDPEKKIHDITKEERKIIVNLLKALPVTIKGLMGYDRAVVADGGLVIKEIDGKTMRSKICENLFVTGDLLHIKRPSGGYSLQLCWTTGYVAGSFA